MEAKLIKIDRNGSKHFEGMIKCDRCGGTGIFAHHIENGHIVPTIVDNGVCHKCFGEGKVLGKWIERTPEYEAKLAAKRKAKQEAKEEQAKAKYAETLANALKVWGFTEDGVTYLFLGNTYQRKDEIKQAGGKFNIILGWHMDHMVEGFDMVEFKIDPENDLWITNEGKIFDLKLNRSEMDAIKDKALADLHPENHTSEFQGEVGERLKGLELTIDFQTTFEGSRVMKYSGWETVYKYFYSMHDANGNIYTWTASNPIESRDFEGYMVRVQNGTKIILDGTVKDHKEYKGDKQTVLTRCKYSA